MLTVLYGTSCVGKTTLIKRLISNYNWKTIPTTVTRSLRPDEDIARISITENEFNQLKKEGKFHCVNRYFGTSYGVPMEEVIYAENNKKDEYILDFMIEDYMDMQNVQHRKIILIPESIDKFTLQVEASGRSNRINEIFRDLENNYNDEKIIFYKNSGFDILLSRFGNVDATLHDFIDICI
jgi:guanylate kinase